MGLLDKLWDDTLAGPRPETGLGKLRKNEAEKGLSQLREHRVNGELIQRSNDEVKQVKQGITIIKPPGYLRSLSVDSPSSSAASSPPISPSSLTPRGRENPWRSKKDINDDPKSPTVYDWVVIGSWER